MICASKPKNYSLDINIGYFYMPSPPIWMLGLKLSIIGNITIHPSGSENYGFDTNIGRFDYFYIHPLPMPSPIGA